MSFIYRDFLTPSRFVWNRANSLYHRFNNVWDKETIDGIEVYSSKLIYWQGTLRTDIPFKRFINILGVEYDTLKNADYKNIRYAYLELDPKKYKYTSPVKSAIVNDLASVFNVNDEFELYIHYTGESKRVVNNHWKLMQGMDPTKISSYTINTTGIRTMLHSNPMKYFANAELTEAGSLLINSNPILSIKNTPANTSPRSTPVTSVEYDTTNGHLYSVLALLDNGTTFEQVGTVYNETSDVNKSSTGDVYLTYSYKIKFKVKAIPTINSYVVDQIYLLGTTMQDSLSYTGSNIYAISNSAVDTSLKKAVIEMNNPQEISEITYNSKFRVDALASMKRKEFSKLLSKSLGTGYKKKKKKWYQVLFAIVLIAISIVIGLPAGGISAAMSSFTAMATSLAMISTALSIGLLVYASIFPYAIDMIRLIGKFAQITGILSSIIGITAIIQKSWEKAAQIALEKKTISSIQQYTVTQFLKDMTINLYDKLKTSIVDKISIITNPSKWSLSSLSSITLNDVSGWLNNINDGIKLYMKFFGNSKQFSTLTENEQASKEDGVESIYLAYEMIDNNDALYKMDLLTKNNLGGQKTENFLSQIT